MTRHLSFLASVLLVGAGTASAARPNVLFIAIDDLRDDLGCFGVKHAKTPQLDAFAATARAFSHHYIQVPTCGASRCAMLRGRYPERPVHLINDAIRDSQTDWAADSMAAVFRRNGYATMALGKVSHYPGNLTGKDWAVGPEELPGAWDRAWVPESPWPSPEGIMHGFANGVPRERGKSPPYQHIDGPDKAYPDAWVAGDAVATLQRLAKQDKPWFFGVGFFKPHLPFASPKKWFDLHDKNVPDLPSDIAQKPAWPAYWYDGGELRHNYGHEPGRDPATDPEYARLLRQAYAGCVSYMDAQLGRVIAALSELGMADNTIVVVWSDHGFLLGEHAIWGKHCLYEDATRSPLMIRVPGMATPGKTSNAIVETVDIFRTLTDLCGIEAPAKLSGHSLRPQLDDPEKPTTKPALGWWSNGVQTVRTERWRMIVTPHDKDAPDFELFDYTSASPETTNLADVQPAVVQELMGYLKPVKEDAPGR
ncbi:MAG: sulfatase [Prosthecobacter sp.]